MKRFILLLGALALLLAPCFLFGQRTVGDGKVYASRFAGTSGRSSGTLNTIISKYSTETVHLVIDKGVWVITNNVTFPSNTVVEFDTASSLLLAAGTVTFNGEIIAGDHAIFSGPGSVAGSPRFLYRYATWGATGTYDIGTGYLPEAIGSEYLTTNNYAYNGGEIVTTNDMAEQMTNAYPNLQTTAVTVSNTYSYIEGMHPQYHDSGTVKISIGEGYCKTDYFISRAIENHTVTGLSGTDFYYILIDNDASTFPDSLTFRNTKVEPALNTNYVQWMVGDDRCIGVVYGTGTVINTYNNRFGDFVFAKTNGLIAANINTVSDGTWKVPDTAETDTLLPINATEALIYFGNDSGAGQSDWTGVTIKEIADVVSAPGAVNLQLHSYGALLHTASGEGAGGSTHGWCPLGQSRKLRIMGENADDDIMGLHIMGWRIQR